MCMKLGMRNLTTNLGIHENSFDNFLFYQAAAGMAVRMGDRLHWHERNDDGDFFYSIDCPWLIITHFSKDHQ